MAIEGDSIRLGLGDLGLRTGDVVLVHSDLRALGRARELVKISNCGADLVIDAFLRVVGPQGLVVFPTFTKTYDTGQRPYTGLVFDRDTPSRVGSITNIFLKRSDAVRGTHPTHSVAAVGCRAVELAQAPDDQTTFDRRGPWGRMHDWDGWICWFGTDNRTNTTVHAVEDWMDLPYMETRHAWVRGADGRPALCEVRKCPSGPRDFYRRDSRAQRLLEASGVIRTGRIGRANVSLLRVRDCHRVLREGIIRDPCLLLADDSPGDEWTRGYRAATIADVRSRFKPAPR